MTTKHQTMGEELEKGSKEETIQLKGRNQLPFRIITHNIRYAATSLDPGECKWQIRRDYINSELLFQTRYCDALIMLQEVLHHQLQDILRNLNQGARDDSSRQYLQWNYVGVGRDDGRTDGEFVPILFQPAVWTLERSRTLWLSLTPDRPSKDWDSGSKRTLTATWLKHQHSGKRLLALNTHLDNASENARRESAKLITKWIRKWVHTDSKHGNLPVVLSGDFNSTIAGEAYKELTSELSAMTDVRVKTPERRKYGHCNTYTGFNDEEAQRIDFILTGPLKTVQWDFEGYAVLENRFEDGIFSSDHRAVVADVAI